ncbi:MAG TPA: hypothetical protein VIG79_01985 [Lapillicoccus sp.]|uniref:hypothetical protein n=1 Tax=Lapillicoccus sp. TaxID=1909287 RepID=UPI002F94906A
MGIGSWFGFGDKSARASEPQPEPAHTVPTSQDLLDAVDRVEQQAKDGKAPGMVQSRLGRVARTVRDTVPRLDTLGSGSPQAYNVMATATNYLPDAIGGYLRLPRQWADSRPVDRGKTPLMILIDQLDLLGATMDKVFDAVCRADAEALVVHGRFLEEKFGAAAGGGDLIIGSTPVPPMPATDPSGPSPLTPPPGRTA